MEVKHLREAGVLQTPAVGMLEHGGDVYAKVQKKLDSKTLSELVKENIDIKKSVVITD